MSKIQVIDRRIDQSEDLPDTTSEPTELSDEVFNLITTAGNEITNILSDGSDVSMIAGILNAIRKLSDAKDGSEALKIWNLDILWDLVTSPPWVKSYIQPLREEIERRFAANPDISIKDAISNIALNCKLKPGFTVVADLNGYSNFQYQATDAQKAELDESYQRQMFALCKKFNAKLLQAPAGDAYVFYVEENLPAFLKALKATKIPVPLRNPDPTMYPDGNFTFSTGVAKSDGDINLSLYTSPKGIEDGLIDVNGPAYVRAIHSQKHVRKNEMEVDNETREYLGEMGMVSKNTIITEADLEEFELTNSKKTNKIEPLPNNHAQAVALLAALAQASHPRGCISTIDKHNRGKESSVNAVGVTSIAFQIGSLDDVGNKQAQYDAVIKKYFALRAKYPEFFTFKKDGEKLHVHTNLPLNEESGKKIVAFCRDMAEIITSEGFDLGVGVGYTESMVRTRIIDSSLEERAGAGIVKSVRLGTEGRQLRLDAEFCKKAFGNIFEFETVKAKGGDVMCLKIELDNIDPENIIGKNLYGIDAEIEIVNRFIEKLGTNGNLLKIHSNLAGSGVSALMRHALRTAIQSGIEAFGVEKIGQDTHASIRGLVCSFYPDVAKNISEEALLLKFDELLLDTETLNEKRLIILDIKEINPGERAMFERFAAAIVTTKTALIHSHDFGGNQIEMKEMNLDDAVEMMMEINDKNLHIISDFDPLSNALKTFSREKNIPLTPRNLIHIYNVALKKEGGRIFFEDSTSDGSKTGELGRKIRGVVSEERQFILGLIASIKFKAKASVLWPVYCSLKGISTDDKKKEQIFLEDLDYLLQHDLLEKSGDNLDLKDKNERNSAMLLAVKEDESFSRMLLDQNVFEDEEIECLEAKFQHLLKAGNRKQLMETCGQIAEYYSKQGLTSEARRIYTAFLTNNGVNELTPEHFDFFIKMAATFHTSDEEQRKIADQIYNIIEIQEPGCETQTNLIWRRYRLCTLDGKNNAVPGTAIATLQTSSDPNELDGIFEMRERQAIFRKLIAELNAMPVSDERDGAIATIEMDNLLRKVYTLRGLKDKRVIEKGELKEYYEDKKNEFKRELDQLMKVGPKGSEETQATFLRLSAGTSNQLGDPRSAIEIFAEAGIKFAKINPPDLFQMNDTLQGVVEAFDYLCREKVNAPNSNREETLEMLEGLEARIRELESSAILSGDIINRANAMLGYCALNEYKIKAIAKSPRIPEDKTLVNEIIATDLRFADNYAKLKLHQTKGAGKEAIMNLSSQAKAELAEAVQLLPIELRS